jgi:hypothetical protein
MAKGVILDLTLAMLQALPMCILFNMVDAIHLPYVLKYYHDVLLLRFFFLFLSVIHRNFDEIMLMKKCRFKKCVN